MENKAKPAEAAAHPALRYLSNGGIVGFLLAMSAMVVGVYFWAALVIFVVAVLLILTDYELEPWVRKRWLAKVIGPLCAAALIGSILRYVAFVPAPLEIQALYIGGSYSPGKYIGGIKWQNSYSDVRVDIVNRSDFDYKDVDISIVPDDPTIGVAELGQITIVPGVYFIAHNFTTTTTITKAKGGFSQESSTRVAPSNLGERVHCDRFAGHNHIQVVVALANLNGSAKPTPTGLWITKEYTTLGGRVRKIKRHYELNSLPR